jgi:hypothetical protein
MRKALVTIGLVWMGAGALWASCAPTSQPLRPGEDKPMGGIQLGLEVAAGFALSEATYTIDGPGNYHREVVVTLSNAPKLATFIGGTPPGRGYVLSVKGLANDGSICSGVSAPFDVIAFQTTLVSMILRCQEPDPTGNIQTNGTLNFCASIDNLMASPGSTPVGGTIALGAGTHDKDMGPGPITYSWTANRGSFNAAWSATPIFTCTAPGPVSISLTISDGDCGDSRSIAVNCSGDTSAPAPDADPTSSIAPDAGAPADAASRPEAAVQSDPCLVCESTIGEPACAANYHYCVAMPGPAAAGPAAGKPRSDLCVDLYTCVHITRCDRGGTLRDCFCGKQVDDQACRTAPVGICRHTFYAAAETSDHATVLARLRDKSFAVGAAAALIEECEEQPAPLCGPSCGL